MNTYREMNAYQAPKRESRDSALSFQPERKANVTKAPAKKETLPVVLLKKAVSLPVWIKENAPGWFDFSRPDTSTNRKTFPVSVFAALLAVCISLMLVVASSVMLSDAEKDLTKLTSQVDVLNQEVEKLQSDLTVNSDMLEIRRVAVEEYGMVDESEIQTTYLQLDREDCIEVYEEERASGVGLSALLSAIGFKK